MLLGNEYVETNALEAVSHGVDDTILKELLGSYDLDPFFGQNLKAIRDDEWPESRKHCRRIKYMQPRFTVAGWRLLYGGRICVPRRAVKQLLRMAHDTSLSGHFAFEKTIHRLDDFH